MSAFSGDSIALTFSADLTQARAAYDQFIADVSRRPIPLQFQGGGAAAAVGASVPNAPGFGGAAGQWATGATASAAAISGRGIIQGPGVGVAAAAALPGAAGVSAGQVINAGSVTINAGSVTLAGGAGDAAAATAAGGTDAPGVGGAAARRGGGGLGGLGSNRMLFALSVAAAAQVAHTSDAVEDARFASSQATGLPQYYSGRAAEWKGLFSGPAGYIARFALDRLHLGGAFKPPTPIIQGYEEQAAEAESARDITDHIEHVTGQRMSRLGYQTGYRTGGLYGARTGETIAGIRATAHAERTKLEQEISERRTINADLQVRPNLTPAEARAIDRRNVEIGTRQDSLRENETTEQFKVLQFQQEQRRQQANIAISVGNRGTTARLRAEGRIGEAGENDFEAGLSEFRRQHETEGPHVQAVVERTIADERAARAQDEAYRIGQRGYATHRLQSLLDRNPLQAQLDQIGSDFWDAMRQATPNEYAGVQAEFGKREELAKQRDADERLSARGRLNVENAGLAILANGPGTYAERQTAAAASDIYGQTLLASLAAIQQGRPELLGGLKRRGGLQLQSLQQQLLAGFRAEEVDLNRVAVSNPQDSLQAIGKIAEDVAKIPGTLDEISKKLDGFDQVQ